MRATRPWHYYGIVTPIARPGCTVLVFSPVVVGVDSRLRRVTVPWLWCTSFPDRFRGSSGPRFLHEPREKRKETETRRRIRSAVRHFR